MSTTASRGTKVAAFGTVRLPRELIVRIQAHIAGDRVFRNPSEYCKWAVLRRLEEDEKRR